MATQTKAELEKELKQTKRGAEKYKEETREAIIEEANNQGLTCEVLDEFLEKVDMEPRGADYVVTVPVKVRADSDEEARQLATDGIDNNASYSMMGESVMEVDHEKVEVKTV